MTNMTFRKWLSRKLWGYAVRLDESKWHDTTFVDGEGNEVVSVFCYGQWTGSWRPPYDMTCSCEDDS